MKRNDFFVWACDYEDYTGEGLLARLFVKNYFLNFKKKIKIQTNNSDYIFFKKNRKIEKKIYKNNFISKYLMPLKGIILIWINHLKGKKVFYINYLPLWAFWIFLLLPKKTILGPITGNIYIKKSYRLDNLIRRFLFPLFYRISLTFVFKKYKKLLFATDNLKKLISKKEINNFLSNFCLLHIEKRKIKKKKIDFTFYYRAHPNKSNKFLLDIIHFLIKRKFTVVIVGDRLDIKNTKNYINLPRDKLLPILDRTKFTIVSDENYYSLYLLDCFSSNVFIFTNYYKKNTKKVVNLTNCEINFSDLKNTKKKLIDVIKNFKKNKVYNKKYLILSKINKIKIQFIKNYIFL